MKLNYQLMKQSHCKSAFHEVTILWGEKISPNILLQKKSTKLVKSKKKKSEQV